MKSTHQFATVPSYVLGNLLFYHFNMSNASIYLSHCPDSLSVRGDSIGHDGSGMELPSKKQLDLLIAQPEIQSNHSYLYLCLRVCLWWDTAGGVIDAIIITKGRWDWTLPPATGRSIIHLPTQQIHKMHKICLQALVQILL